MVVFRYKASFLFTDRSEHLENEDQKPESLMPIPRTLSQYLFYFFNLIEFYFPILLFYFNRLSFRITQHKALEVHPSGRRYQQTAFHC